MQSANDDTAVIVQAEHRDAVANIEAIVQSGGRRWCADRPVRFVGESRPAGRGRSSRMFVTRSSGCRTACSGGGVPIGIFGLTAEAVRPYIDKGFTMIVAGVDTVLLGNAATTLRVALRNVRLRRLRRVPRGPALRLHRPGGSRSSPRPEDLAISACSVCQTTISPPQIVRLMHRLTRRRDEVVDDRGQRETSRSRADMPKTMVRSSSSGSRANGRIEDADRREQHQPLVRLRIAAGA